MTEMPFRRCLLPLMCTLGGALPACAEPAPNPQLTLELCWGATPGADCETTASAPEEGRPAAQPAPGSGCGAAALAPIAEQPRVGQRLPISLWVSAPELDSAAPVRLSASGSLALLRDGALVPTLDWMLPPSPESARLETVEVTALGAGRIELQGLGETRSLSADVAAPLALGLQPPRFRRLQGLSARAELVVCSSLPAGEIGASTSAGELSASSATLSAASAGVCPAGYPSFATLLWTGADTATDLLLTQRDQTLSCAVQMPGVITKVSAVLAREPLWTQIDSRFTTSVEVRVTGQAAEEKESEEQPEQPLEQVAVSVTGPSTAEIGTATLTDADGTFSFLVTAPEGTELPLTLFIGSRFRRPLRLTVPAAQAP